MKKYEKIYDNFCKVELYIACALLVSIFILVFTSALARTLGHPINWAQDLSLVFFAWMTFIGGDYLLRCTKMISIDMLIRKLPKPVQKTMHLIFNVLIMALLVFFIIYGFRLFALTQQRMITTIGIPYAFVTLSVPVGSLLMSTSVIINTIKYLRTPTSEWEESKV